MNRTLPAAVADAPPALTFSSEPTAAELFRAAVFREPLVPMRSTPTVAENQALVTTFKRYGQRTDPEDFTALDRFLAEHPDSPWRVAVLVNLGFQHYSAGRFSRTFPAWEEAWRLGKDATEPQAKALVDRAVAELIKMNARVGRIGDLDRLFAELGNRPLTGSAGEIVASARQSLHRMKHEPWIAFRCGPFALDRIMAYENPGYVLQTCTYESRSTTNGLSLQEVHQLAGKMGLKMQPAKRTRGAALPLPAVINWKVDHYAAVVAESDGRFLIQDPTFGPQMWISRETLEQEASGYFLVKAGSLPPGWRAVPPAEAATVFGKGNTTGSDPSKPDSNEPQTSDPKSCGQSTTPHGMATYSGKLMSISLHLQDTPIGYSPPRGPAIEFTLDYNQREQNQPANFTFANFGQKWTFNWTAYILDNTNSQVFAPALYKSGGGMTPYCCLYATNSVSDPDPETRTILTRTSPTSYSLAFPDGTRHIFARSVGSATTRNVFLTAIIDPHGNTVDLFYDATNRLVAIRDAIGQVSTLSYELPGDLYKITRITDPFGRSARFDYYQGLLTNITDIIGIQSGFTYNFPETKVNPAIPYFSIDSLTTPYGTSRFRSGQDGASRWLEMTDPEGATERIEFRHQSPGIPFNDPTGVPKGIHAFNEYISFRNTFYWDKKAFREAAGDYTRARIYHWLHTTDINVVSSIIENVKEPLENRVWYNYPGQAWAGGVGGAMTAGPSRIGRILDDGSTQLYQYEYNALGKVTKAMDPMGRTTVYNYATNLMDLVEVRQTAGVNEVLETRTYNEQHLPLTIADGSGHTNRYTYNPAGQLLTFTNPRGDTTTLNYDTNGYLMSIDAALPGTNDTTRFTYDSYGRVRTVTDAEGYTLTYDYDALDRRTRTTCPDGTYEEVSYLGLDPSASRDRNGRITRYTYNGNRRLTSVEDPLHRITRYDWCACGQMSALIDPMGRVTQWHRDIQGRVIAKEYADGSQVRYAYEGTTSRLKSVTDEKSQVKIYDYLPDNNLAQVRYQNAENPTPDVRFTYDSAYNRIKTMSDGIGLTTYGYYPASTNGGRLAFEDGPWANDTITYDYDETGRVRSRAINAAAQHWTYDPLGRVTVLTNLLGVFTNTYVGDSFRLRQTRYPNGQWTDYAYHENAGDQRLKEIHHQLPGGQTLSRFAYAYDPSGQITNWLQQAGSEIPESWDIRYDAAQQLLSVVNTTNGVVHRTFGYGYDPAGNRLFEDTDGIRSNFAYNPLNQIQSTDDAGLNPRSYRWDAENRLVAILWDTNHHDIAYDGLGRYVHIVHYDGPNALDDARFLWCGDSVCQERDAFGQTVRKHFFESGQIWGNETRFNVMDHLGSLRAVTRGDSPQQGFYAYSPYGTQSTSAGAAPVDDGFTGHHHIEGSDLVWTRYRTYDPKLARWLSRDLLDESGGANLYGYVFNDPINMTDPLGLKGAQSGTKGPNPSRGGGNVPGTAGQVLHGCAVMTAPFNPITALGLGVMGMGMIMGDASSQRPANTRPPSQMNQHCLGPNGKPDLRYCKTPGK